MNLKKICIFGKDKRMEYLFKNLKEAGFYAEYYPNETEYKENGFDYYIFPVGTDIDIINKMIDNNKNSHFFVGNSNIIENNVFDYFKDEVVTIKNTIPTAEGAIAIAINETEHTLFGSECLVLGYGKVAKTLAGYLGCFGANVTVGARKERDRVQASINLFETVEIADIESVIDRFNIIFNTIPAKIIDSTVLKGVRDDCLIIDLASKPGGVDFKEAELLGKRVIWALGLPGKTAPQTAASYIFKYIYDIITKGDK